MYCPACGSKLILLAVGSVSKGDDTKFGELLDKHERFSKVMKERPHPFISSGIRVYFVVCVKCKRLMMNYGTNGHYFDILGTLTDEALALMVANSMKDS